MANKEKTIEGVIRDSETIGVWMGDKYIAMELKPFVSQPTDKMPTRIREKQHRRWQFELMVDALLNTRSKDEPKHGDTTEEKG